MKKVNFKVLLTVILCMVLGLSMAMSLAACDETTETPITPDVTPPSIYLAEVLAGLDVTANSLADLTDVFEANIQFYAEINSVVYMVAIKANVDIRNDEAANANNKLSVEVTKDADLVAGLYYNGAQDAIFLNIPGENIKRYIDKFDLVTTLYDVADLTAVEGGFASQMPEVAIADAVASFLSYIDTFEVFSDVIVTTEGGVTSYDFVLNSELVSTVLPIVLPMLSDYLVTVNGAVDSLFGTEGFDIASCTIPSFSLDLLADVDATEGLTKFAIALDVPAFSFYINDEEGTEPIAVNAFNMEAGINLLCLGAADSDYSVDITVPTTSTEGYTYFSPLNLNTSGRFDLDGEGGAAFSIKSDINPFDLMYGNYTDAEVAILIETWDEDHTFNDREKVFALNILDGDAYVDVRVDGELEFYTLDIADAIELAGDVIEGLQNGTYVIDMPESDGPEIDMDAVLALVMSVTDLVEGDTITIDKAFIEEVIDTFGLDQTLEDNGIVLPEDVVLTGSLLRDEDDNVNGVRGEAYIMNCDGFVAIGTAETYTGTRFAATFVEAVDGAYKLDGTVYVLIGEEEVYEGTRYDGTFVVSESGTYKPVEPVENVYYVEALVAGDVLTVEVGKVIADVDAKVADAVFTLNKTAGTITGFNLLISKYDSEGELDEVLVDLTLSEFTFVWGDAVTVGAAETAGAEYDDVLDGVTAQMIVDTIQNIVYGMFDATEIEFVTFDGSDVESIYGFEGEAVTAPANPTLEGSTFGGWYDNEGCTGDAYVFTTIPAEDITLFAKWTLNE